MSDTMLLRALGCTLPEGYSIPLPEYLKPVLPSISALDIDKRDDKVASDLQITAVYGKEGEKLELTR